MNLNIRRPEWVILLLLSLASIVLWLALALPRYQVIDLSIDRQKAISIAKVFLNQKLNLNPEGYQLACVFSMDENGDRYLQKTLGVKKAREFIQRFKYDLFYWDIRFFKEHQKEEFRVIVSSKTGEVISFSHALEDTAARGIIPLEEARQRAIDFINQNYHLSLSRYLSHSQHIEKKENRVDYSFSWEVKNVEIPWSNQYGGGRAQLLMTIGISGNDVLYYNKNQLSIPEGFSRYIDNLKQTGENLMLISRLFYIGLLTVAIMLLINRKRFVIPQMVRSFYLGAGCLLFILIILDVLNGYQHLIFNYPTSQSFGEYVFKDFLGTGINIFFTALVFILPGLTGESLRYEVSPENKKGSLLSPVLSSFFTIPVARQIWIGYLITPFILAVQALIFLFGYRYFGVWDEMSWLIQSSTSVLPALTAFVFGFHASITEETMFRLFAINLFRRYGLGTFFAVFLSALMWGFGHTGYEVFPMWFRGIEVTLLGIIFGYAYLRFGLITVLVAHFAMDSFRYSLQFIIAPRMNMDFLSCILVLLLPLIFSLVAYYLNASTEEKSWRQKFTAQQEFNFRLLKQICSSKSQEELKIFREELNRHGWDPAIVERVFEDL